MLGLIELVPKISTQYLLGGLSNWFFFVGLGSKLLTGGTVFIVIVVSIGFCDNNAHPSSLAFLCLGLSNNTCIASLLSFDGTASVVPWVVGVGVWVEVLSAVWVGVVIPPDSLWQIGAARACSQLWSLHMKLSWALISRQSFSMLLSLGAPSTQ